MEDSTVHLMMNIKTFGTKPGMIIDQIGLVVFDQNQIISHALYELPVFPALAAGFGWSETINEWRKRQQMKSFEQTCAESNWLPWSHVCDMIAHIHDDLEKFNIGWVWQKGMMDAAMLDSYSRMCCGRVEGFCEHWRVNDLRTYLRAFNEETRWPTNHNAKDDSLLQVVKLHNCWLKHGYNFP